MTIEKSRGIRNNNPGNIDYNPNTKWQGLDDPPIEQGVPKPRFCRFKDATYGIRAIARLLITYQDKHGIDSVQGVINRWAPAVENDTDAYINRVAKKMGVKPREVIDLHDFDTLYALTEAIITHENGYQPYTKAQITKGLVLAGVEPDKKPMVKSRTIQASATAGAGGAVAAGAGIIAAAAPAVPVVQGLAESVQENATGMLIVLGLITVLAAGYIAWSRYDDRRKGLR